MAIGLVEDVRTASSAFAQAIEGSDAEIERLPAAALGSLLDQMSDVLGHVNDVLGGVVDELEFGQGPCQLCTESMSELHSALSAVDFAAANLSSSVTELGARAEVRR